MEGVNSAGGAGQSSDVDQAAAKAFEGMSELYESKGAGGADGAEGAGKSGGGCESEGSHGNEEILKLIAQLIQRLLGSEGGEGAGKGAGGGGLSDAG